MNCIAFHYLYRDFSNYKQHNVVYFSNPNNLPLAEIEQKIRARLIDEMWFNHQDWNLPDLHFEKTDWKDDHPYHEFNYCETATKAPTIHSTIDAFLKLIHSLKIVN